MLNTYRSENTVAFIRTNTFGFTAGTAKFVYLHKECDATNSIFANMFKVQREQTMRAEQKIHKQQSVVF